MYACVSFDLWWCRVSHAARKIKSLARHGAWMRDAFALSGCFFSLHWETLKGELARCVIFAEGFFLYITTTPKAWSWSCNFLYIMRALFFICLLVHSRSRWIFYLRRARERDLTQRFISGPRWNRRSSTPRERERLQSSLSEKGMYVSCEFRNI